MAADHSSRGSNPLSKKGRSPMSKTELKMSLVAKRLAMLQHNDDDDGGGGHIQPVPIEIPMQHERLHSDDSLLKISGSSRSREANEDLSSEDIIPMSNPNRRKHTSHKRRVVSIDDESEEDGEHHVLVQPTKKERTKRQKIISNDSSDHENVKASDAPRMHILRKMEPIDNSTAENKSSAMKRAKLFQANLSAECPSFVKLMLPSHVSRVFWLHMPTKFCIDYLPKCNSTFVLVDEAGKRFDTNYLAHKSSLSGGWRGFAVQHELHEGDVLVFHLFAPTTFKVYIVREDNLGEFDGALGLLNLETGAGQCLSEDHAEKFVNSEDNSLLDSLSPSSNSDVDVGPEVSDGLRFSECIIDFEAVKGFEDFNVTVDGLVIDSKLSYTTREKYYKLCCCQKSFLHERLLKGLNCNLVVGVITETVNIADAVKVCTASTPLEDIKIWEKTLKGFELLGMKVAFLLSKLNQLLGIASEFDMADESNRFRKCVHERACAGERMKALESKLAELKGIMQNIDMEMEQEIMASAQKHEAKIKEIANSLW